MKKQAAKEHDFFGKNTYLHMYVNYVNINIKLSIIISR